jgi:hypothetical protein
MRPDLLLVVPRVLRTRRPVSRPFVLSTNTLNFDLRVRLRSFGVLGALAVNSLRPVQLGPPSGVEPAWPLYGRGVCPGTQRHPLNLERMAGVEPAYRAWHARALPLGYTRKRHPFPFRTEHPCARDATIPRRGGHGGQPGLTALISGVRKGINYLLHARSCELIRRIHAPFSKTK